MPNFVFKLQPILEFRRNRRELCLLLLSQLVGDEGELADYQARLDRAHRHQLSELRTLGIAGEVDVDRSAARRFYSSQLVGDIRSVERQRQLVAQQIALCRQTLVEADRQVKVLEKLREKQWLAFRMEQSRRETRELEEAWMATRATGYAR